MDLKEALDEVELRFLQIMDTANSTPAFDQKREMEDLAENVREIITNQDKLGRWIVYQDKFRKEVQGQRWNGEYRIEDRISSALFNHNVVILCEFLYKF